MKKVLVIILLGLSSFAFSQSEILKKYNTANNRLQTDNFTEAYKIFKEIETQCDTRDTLYNYILWYCVKTTSQLEWENRLNEKFDVSLKYGLEALKYIEKENSTFDDKANAKKFWMHKNLVVSYFCLKQLDSARKHQDILYKANKENKLPDGLDKYYNFDYFKWEGKNIWGYEWYEELPDDRLSKSFSKIVYYIYSANPDGSDKDQLYRLHVLMFHKYDESVKFDYVLTKIITKGESENSRTLYKYTYNKEIDYVKLHSDIIEVLKKESEAKKEGD
ncbi:MAG: hypothetical protein V2A54_04880 [Bacteroidota bacterium]